MEKERDLNEEPVLKGTFREDMEMMIMSFRGLGRRVFRERVEERDINGYVQGLMGIVSINLYFYFL